MKIKSLDAVIFILALAIVLCSFRYSFFSSKNGSPVVSITACDTEYVYPLSENRTVRVNGILGESVIAIENNSVQFISSPCYNHLCESSPVLKKNGDWSACLPNEIFVQIKGNDNTLDAMTN